MGEAIISRLLARQVYRATEVFVSDPNRDRCNYLAERYGVQVSGNNQAVQSAQMILLAIKPQVFAAVAAELTSGPISTSLIVSILAGVPLQTLEKAFPQVPVIRAMPNTPATVGAGITALAPGKQVQPVHLTQAEQIFKAVGEVVIVEEALMDAVTGLSGSGPGYVAIAIEALTDGGVAAGLPRAIAAKLALQTVLGTAVLLQETELHPAQLKDRVTSPGGTTIAGIAALEKSNFRAALIAAVQAATQRSTELGSH